LLTLPLEADDLEGETAWTELLENLKAKLTPDKFNVAMKYFTFPMSISVMANDIALDLYKVFDGRNAIFQVDYPHDRAKEFIEPMLSALNVQKWIEDVGKIVLKDAPNTIVVLDKDVNGDPLLLAVRNEQLHSYEFNKDGSFKFVCFVHSKGVDENRQQWTRYAVYDDAHYRVILCKGNTEVIEVENPHNLGACPARFFYNNPLVNNQSFNRENPFSCVRGIMGQWQVFDLFDYWQDHYASFQILQTPDNGCNDPDCYNGQIYHEPILNEDNVLVKAGYQTDCPACAKNKFVAPGTSIGVVVGADKEDNDTRDIVKFIAPDIGALEYSGKKQLGRERFIKENVVGFSDAINNEAVNETQIKALVESRKKPLLDIKAHLEDLYTWIVEGFSKLVYDADVKAMANYGTEFFILTVDDIIQLITSAKIAGVQASYIEQLNKLLIVTEYKNNPAIVQEMLIAADLEPNAYDTQEESRLKWKEGIMTTQDYYLKSNFTDLINQFKRENGSLVTFGIELPYETKIQRIRTTLDYYINLKIPKTEENEQASDTEPIAASDSRT
jgi:hypothetical protein